jgi:hypothetical protein
MMRTLLLLTLLLPFVARAGLTCGQVVAGMRGETPFAAPDTMWTLLEGAWWKDLPVLVTYRKRWPLRGSQTVIGFVLAAPTASTPTMPVFLQTDRRPVRLSPERLEAVQVLEAPPTPKLSSAERRALDCLLDAWERQELVQLHLHRSARRGLAGWLDVPYRVRIRQVRPSVAGGWLVDYEEDDVSGWTFRTHGTWRFDEIVAESVRR